MQNVIEHERIAARIARLRACFDGGRTRPLSYRRQQLAALDRFLKEREREIQEALKHDLGKPSLESAAVEVSFVRNEVQYAQKYLRSWAKPERVRTSLISQPARSRIYREPLGVVLIIGPWNYPVQLILAPLVGAIAAGNCTIIKPSEISAATSSLLVEHLPKYMDNECIQVVEGGPSETTALLAERFDHILYTGNGTVGRIVMEAAAKNLTPVTLELGGKSPCVVDRTADISVTARRILWGKLLNAGQSCLAPDYVLVDRTIKESLLEKMKSIVVEFLGSDPRQSHDFARIINARHYHRLMALMASGDALIGGEGDEDELYIAPTIMHNVSADSSVMREEIFGPILPVLSVADMDEAISFVNARPKPLALYLFTSDTNLRERVIERTSSGAVLVNHTCMHAVVPSLPFGGVGESGMGAYHGKASFETFSHRKAVMLKPTVIDLRFLYPPYTRIRQKLIRSLL